MSGMAFSPGTLVHVAGLGKGTVREVRNGGRYLVEVKGRALVTNGDQLTLQESPKKAVRAKPQSSVRAPHGDAAGDVPPAYLDLHGYTVAEALEATSAFLNNALLDGRSEARIIHGRSGGKIKAALHGQLRKMPSIRNFGIDPHNEGATIIRF